MAFKFLNLKKLDEQKIPIKFSLNMLNAFIAYTLKRDKNITRANLNNLNKLVSMIDYDLYKNDQFLKYRLEFLKKILKLKLQEGVDDPKILLDGGMCGYPDLDKDIICDVSTIQLRKREIKYLTKVISNKLSYCFIYKHREHLIDLFGRIDDVDNDDEETIKEIKTTCSMLLNDVRKSEVSDEETFSLNPKVFNKMIIETVNKISAPNYKLKFGIKMLNELLSGGVEPGRFYMFLGLPAGGKSLLLLNLAYNIKLYNKGYKPNNPNNTPTVLYLTQENRVLETIQRLFTLSASSDKSLNLKDYTPEEAMRLLKEEGQLTLTQENNVDIVIMFKAGNSIDTGDIYGIIDDLEDEGREVICLIHDYLKKLKPVNKSKELRLELGYVVDELKNLAVDKNIPVISASQLNRDAAKTVDLALESNKSDVGKLLSKSNVGESWNMIENCDWACIINKEFDASEQKFYMSFKRIKIRFEPLSDVNYIAHPFDNNNKMRLQMDDSLLEPVSKLTLGNDFGITTVNNNGRKNAKKRQTVPVTFDQSSADLSNQMSSEELSELIS